VASAPAVLSNGAYCLTSDVTVVNQAGFFLDGDAVLDCRGHTISGAIVQPYSGPLAFGVVISGPNSAVKNCVIEGFHSGIQALDDYFRIENNTLRGFQYYAIYTDANQGLIKGNLVHSAPGSGRSGMIYAQGVVDIVGNVIFGAEGPADKDDFGRFGIRARYDLGGVIARNVVRNILPSHGGYGAAIDLIGQNPLIYRNTMTAIPGRGDMSVFCESGVGVAILNTIVGYDEVLGCRGD
jgi:hypothetical protein